MSRARRGSTSAPPTNDADFATLLEKYMLKDHCEPIWVSVPFLEEMNMREQVTERLIMSGWPGLLDLSCAADQEDTSEFLASFEYKTAQGEHGITYKHRGINRQCFIGELRAVYGMDEFGGEYYVPAHNNWDPVWNSMCSFFRYEGGESKAKAFDDPYIFYMHHILAKTLLAKKNIDKVTRPELGVLHLLKSGQRVDWAQYLCRHWSNLRGNSPLCVGGMITYLLRAMHPLPVPSSHHILQYAYADRVWFQFGQNLQVTHEGELQWCYFLHAPLRPPPVVPRPRGRPRGGGRGRGRARGLAIAEPDEEQHQQHHYQQQDQHHQHQAQLAQMQTDYIFNSTRASMMYGQQITIVSAPPGWTAGDPIPPEYMQPHPPAGGY